MRADDVSPAMTPGHAAPVATSPYARPTTGPQPVVPSSAHPEQVRADLLYEFELELRHTAKALARSKAAPAPILIADPVPDAKPGVPDVSWRTTEVRGWMVGPTAAGRVLRVLADVGDSVQPGQLLAEMDPVDLDQRIVALDASLARTRSAQAAAQAAGRGWGGVTRLAGRKPERL